jgi:flagellar basal body-associated protein FliL
MKKIKGKNKGITLIALIVTIIVLLILAGVSIAMLTGENGILNRASYAVIQTEIARNRRRSKFDIYF